MLQISNSKIRKKLDKALFDSYTPDEFCERISERSCGRFITIVKNPYNKQECRDYTGQGSFEFYRDFEKAFEHVDAGDEQIGDIVLYTYGDNPYIPEHVGIHLGEWWVVSKWGEGGPVLVHPLDHIPSKWGDKVHFFRRENPFIPEEAKEYVKE